MSKIIASAGIRGAHKIVERAETKWKEAMEYKLFKADGAPLRAIVTMGFVGYISEEMAAAEAERSSPDMTHIVTIKEGDTLVDLCCKIYGKSKYYLYGERTE